MFFASFGIVVVKPTNADGGILVGISGNCRSHRHLEGVGEPSFPGGDGGAVIHDVAITGAVLSWRAKVVGTLRNHLCMVD